MKLAKTSEKKRGKQEWLNIFKYHYNRIAPYLGFVLNLKKRVNSKLKFISLTISVIDADKHQENAQALFIRVYALRWHDVSRIIIILIQTLAKSLKNHDKINLECIEINLALP